MLKKILTLIVATALLAGCSLHQPLKIKTSTDIPERYLEQTAQAEAAVTPDRWWLAFNDDLLNLLMDELFAENLELEQAFARLEQVRAVLKSTDSSLYPSLSLDAQRGRNRQPQLSGNFTGDSWQASAAARFEIDLWGKLSSRSEAAGKDMAAGEEELKTLYLSLSSQLAELYYQAVAQRAQLDLTDKTIASVAETLTMVESRYRQGLVPAVDVYQARQNLTAAKANRHTTEASLAVAEHAIAVLIGRYPDRDSAGELNILPPTPRSFPAGLPSELIAERPDLTAALRRIEAADTRVAAAIADRFPSINLIGSYGHTSQETTAGLLEGNFWSLLGQFAMPVFDAGRRKAEVERNRAAVREAVAKYQQSVLLAFREVEDALARNRTTELRIDQLVATVNSTDASLRLSRDRYLSGLTDYLPVLTAQRNHFETQTRLLSARQQLISERIALARSLGGNWMTEKIDQRRSSLRAENHE